MYSSPIPVGSTNVGLDDGGTITAPIAVAVRGNMTRAALRAA